jgi:hypothetical protein
MKFRTKRILWAGVFCIGLACNGLGMAQGAPLSSTPRPTWTELNPVTRLTAETFVYPPATDRPWVRVNTPADLSPE